MEDASRGGWSISEIYDKTVRKVQPDQEASSHDIVKELNIHRQAILNHRQTAGYEINLHVSVRGKITRKNIFPDAKSRKITKSSHT